MRARNIKPSIFKNELLARLGPWHFILFTGLWCLADRKGRLEDRQDRIEAELFPFKFQKVEISQLLDDLVGTSTKDRFILRYKVKQNRYIQIVNFEKHQYPNIKEQESTIPAPYKHGAKTIPALLNPPSPLLNTESPKLNPGVLNTENGEKSARAIASLAAPSFGKTATPEAPYEVPLPETEPLGALVLAYKVLKGFKHDDRQWDRDNWGRTVKTMKTIFDTFGGNFKTILRFMETKAFEFKKQDKANWRIDWIVSDAHDWKLKMEGSNGSDENGNRESFSRAVALRRAKAGGQGHGGFASANDVLDNLGYRAPPPARNESGNKTGGA